MGLTERELADHLRRLPGPELAERLGIKYVTGPCGPAPGPVHMRVDFFKLGDPGYTDLGPDGAKFPMGQPVEELRAQFGGDRGSVQDGWGNSHELVIPADVRDGEENWASIRFVSLKPGCGVDPDELLRRPPMAD